MQRTSKTLVHFARSYVLDWIIQQTFRHQRIWTVTKIYRRYINKRALLWASHDDCFDLVLVSTLFGSPGSRWFEFFSMHMLLSGNRTTSAKTSPTVSPHVDLSILLAPNSNGWERSVSGMSKGMHNLARRRSVLTDHSLSSSRSVKIQHNSNLWRTKSKDR